MDAHIRIILDDGKKKSKIDVNVIMGDMFVAAIVPQNKKSKRYLSWVVCEHHKEDNAVNVWHIQTLTDKKRTGLATTLINMLKINHDTIETNYETTNDDGYLFFIKQGFKEIKAFTFKERKVLQWKKKN